LDPKNEHAITMDILNIAECPNETKTSNSCRHTGELVTI